MTNPAEFDARLSAVESRMEQIAADTAAAVSDAAAARHLAAARDRDLADLTIKVDANRQAINALDVQTAARFDQVEQRFDRLEQRVDAGFAEMRGKFDPDRRRHGPDRRPPHPPRRVAAFTSPAGSSPPERPSSR